MKFKCKCSQYLELNPICGEVQALAFVHWSSSGCKVFSILLDSRFNDFYYLVDFIAFFFSPVNFTTKKKHDEIGLNNMSEMTLFDSPELYGCGGTN